MFENLITSSYWGQTSTDDDIFWSKRLINIYDNADICEKPLRDDNIIM